MCPPKKATNAKPATRSPRRVRKNNRIAKVKQIPMAYATSQKKPHFRRISSKNSEQEIIIEGEDLIIPTPNTLPTTSTHNSLFLTVPANPLYWTGTRISGIANVYQQYRPLHFEVEYIPQVPVTVPGQVIMGTLWNNGAPEQSLQQTLMSSNGGRMTQCYKPCRSNVICNRTTLPLNQYNVHDDMALNTTNPFLWVAHYSGAWSSGTTPTTNQPGWIYVRWRYLFSIGLGNRGYNVAVYNEMDATIATRINAFPGWGVVLSFFANKAVKLLRKIGIVLIEETIATLEAIKPKNDGTVPTVTLPVGSTFTVSPDDLRESVVKVKGSDGVEYYINNSTRACVYMEGDAIIDSADVAGSLSIDYVESVHGGQLIVDFTYNDEEITHVKIDSWGASSYPDATLIEMDLDHELYYYPVSYTVGPDTRLFFSTPGEKYSTEYGQSVQIYCAGNQIDVTNFLSWAVTLPEQQGINKNEIIEKLAPYGIEQLVEFNGKRIEFDEQNLRAPKLLNKEQITPKNTILMKSKLQPQPDTRSYAEKNPINIGTKVQPSKPGAPTFEVVRALTPNK